MTFEVLLKQIVKEAVAEAISENMGNLVISKADTDKAKTVLLNNEPKKEAKKEKPSKEVDDVVESDEDVAVEETEISEVDLGSMKLKELREYAEELGINSKGKRAELEERIQEFLNSEESEEEDLDEEPEDDVEESEEKSEDDDSEEIEESDEEEEESEDNEKYAQVKEYVENASDEEIKETLKELGLSTKGKREALIEKLYQAVKDGLFEFAEDDEDLEDTEDVEDIEEESEEDDSEDTEERIQGIEELNEKVREDFESGDLTRKDMTAYLKQVGVAVTKKVDDDNVLDMYIEKLSLLVDDEGEFHEEGEDPYTINGVPYCCGAKLEELEDGGYKCNVCGAEYDDDEE